MKWCFNSFYCSGISLAFYRVCWCIIFLNPVMKSVWQKLICQCRHSQGSTYQAHDWVAGIFLRSSTVHCMTWFLAILVDLAGSWIDVHAKLNHNYCGLILQGSFFVLKKFLTEEKNSVAVLMENYPRTPKTLAFSNSPCYFFFLVSCPQFYPACWLLDCKHHACPRSKLCSNSAELSRGATAAHTHPRTNPGNSWRRGGGRGKTWEGGGGAKGYLSSVFSISIKLCTAC